MAENERKGKISKKLILGVGALVIIAVIGVSIYLYSQYKKGQDLLKNPTLAAQVEAKTLIAQVGNLIELPTGEQPTIATVSDVTKLKGQTFFAKAKNGDKVLIYPKAGKAILYDPSENKIVEVGPVNIGAKPTPSAPVKIALYNGTTTSGLAGVIEKELLDKKANVTIVLKTNAAKTNYTKTLVVDLTASNAAGAGKYQVAAKNLATLLGGEVGTLPAGETAPKDAEILVILGK